MRYTTFDGLDDGLSIKEADLSSDGNNGPEVEDCVMFGANFPEDILYNEVDGIFDYDANHIRYGAFSDMDDIFGFQYNDSVFLP